MNSKSLAEYFLNRGCLCNLKPSPSPISLYLLKNNYLSEFKNDSELVLENLGISEILLGLLEDIDAIASEVGGHYVYRYKNSATKPNKPDTGTDGSSDGWTESPTDPQEGVFTWMSQTYVSGLGAYGIWTEAVRITGADGIDGADGKYVEFIYMSFEEQQSFGANNNNPAYWEANQTPDYTGPSGYQWYDNSAGVTATFKYEYMAQRTFNGTVFSKFTTPVIWSRWGEKGQDGAGTEYIYKVTATPEQISAPVSVQQDDYVPTELGWHDDPQTTDSSTPYQWVSRRKKVNGTWQEFSTPVIWSKYTTNGDNGGHYEYRYKNSPTSPAAPTGDGTTGGWASTPTTPALNEYTWLSQSFVTGSGRYGVWSPPARISGLDGANGTSIQIKGVVDNVSELPDSGNENGDAYLVGLYLYVWVDDDWVNAGQFKGDQGDPGNDGTSQYIHYAWCNTSDNSDGSFTTTKAAGTTYVYMGIAVDDEERDPDQFSDYTWNRYLGEPGIGQKGADGWSVIPSINALILSQSTSDLNDFGIGNGIPITFTAKQGDTSATVVRIEVVQSPPMGLTIDTTGTAGSLIITDYSKVGSAYVTRSNLNCTVRVSTDGGSTNQEFLIVIPVAVNLTGTWLSQIEGATLTETARQLTFGYEHPDSSHLTTIETFGKYIRSSDEMTSEITETIDGTAGPSNTFSSYMSQTARDWKLEITDGLELTGIYIDSHEIKCKARKFGIYDQNDVQTFSIDDSGNLTSIGNASFNGKITSTGGSIGGWNIESTKLSKTTYHSVLAPFSNILELSPDTGFTAKSQDDNTGATDVAYLGPGALTIYYRNRSAQITTGANITGTEVDLFNNQLRWQGGAARPFSFGTDFISDLLYALSSQDITASGLAAETLVLDGSNSHIEFSGTYGGVADISYSTYASSSTSNELHIGAERIKIESTNGIVLHGGTLIDDYLCFKVNTNTIYFFNVSAAISAGILTT